MSESIELPNGDVSQQFNDDYDNHLGSRFEMMLRFIPIALCIAVVIIVLNSSQTSPFGTVTYDSLPALRYLVAINGVSAGYSLLSFVFVAVLKVSMARAWSIFLLDQTLTLLMLGAGSMSAEALYLMKNGDDVAGWSEAWSSFGRFCNKTKISVIITFMALACYLLLSFVRSYKLFSLYNFPSDFLRRKRTIEIVAIE